MLRTRVITAVVGIPLLLYILYRGGVYWHGLFILIGIIALGEYHRMMVQGGFKPLIIPSYLLLLATLFIKANPGWLEPFMFVILVASSAFMIFRFPHIKFADVALSLFGSLYLGFLLGFAIKTAELDLAFPIVLLAFLLTWSSDIGGYFAGRFWGKNKLAPVLSPAKTCEGAVGATLLPVFIALAFFKIMNMGSINIAYVLLLGIIAGFLAQGGDLFESGLKRYFGVKDSGRLIPGHGGVLDRFDSFMFVMPWVYYFFIYLT
ncbi:MAG: phosphatidate cytidylyltransferase [Deltaproteobacteria bacterium]